MRDAGQVVEIAGLIVSGLSLVLAGLSARREKVKDDRAVIGGLVALYHRLYTWREDGRSTNHALHRVVERVLATDDEDERRRMLPDERLTQAANRQSGSLNNLQKETYSVDDATRLFRVYAPDTADALTYAFSRRYDLVFGLALTARQRYAQDGVAGLEALLTEADETMRLLGEACETLRTFIKDNVPVGEYTTGGGGG